MDSLDANDPIIWRPHGDYLSGSNLCRFMDRHRIGDLAELVRHSVEDIEWFWTAALEDINIEWYAPFERLLDDSRGLPWCRWFLSGRLNIVHNCLDRHARRSPGSLALIWEGEDGEVRRFTYSQLSLETDRVAAALVQLGIGRGDAVGFYMPMVPELIASFFAVLKLGAVAVPVFSAFGPEALAVRLRDAEAKILFTADGGYRRGQPVPVKASADAALATVPSVERVIVLKRTGAALDWNGGRDLWWSDFIGRSSGPAATVAMDPEDPCLIIYTSGTTGRPKGAVHTHGGALAQTAKELSYYFDVRPGDRFFWLTDIGWMMGPWEMIGASALGATLVIYEGAPDWPHPGRLWEMAERHRLTHLGMAPTAVRLLMRAGDRWVENHSLDSLRILGSTGEPWDPESYLWFFRKVGRGRSPIINISGGTELIGCLVACTPVAPLKACSFQSQGLGMDVDVVDDDGRPVRDRVGHLVLRQPAPSLTRGFLNDPARYLETYFSRWPGIWYHGDWARIDPQGFWFITGRADDTIKVAGKRTGPAEIEAALLGHAAVSEAAAIGVPDRLRGEAVVCFVVLRDPAADAGQLEPEILEWVAARLGRTLRPRRIHFVTALPKTRSAKIVRGAIKRRYLGLPPGDISSIEDPKALESLPTAADGKVPPQSGTAGG